MAEEKHYRAKDLAELWGFSASTIINLFRDEPGVLKLASATGERRRYVTLSIPESVATRVRQRLCNQPFEAKPARRRPLRVVRLRDLHAGVPEQPRDIVKLHSRKQAANSKGVTKTVGSAVRYPASATDSAHQVIDLTGDPIPGGITPGERKAV